MQKHKTKYLKDYKVPEYLIESIDLYVNLDEEITTVKSTMHIIKNPDSEQNTNCLILNGEEIELKSLFLDKKPFNDYKLTNNLLTLKNIPDEFELTIVNTLHPEKNSTLEGLYKSGKMFITQCEAEGFRKITYFIDRPDIMAKFTCTIEADIYKYPHILSNGNLINKQNLGNGRHIATWHDPFKKPCYLFALVAGNFFILEDEFITMNNKSVKLQIFVEHENKDKCNFAMESLKKAMKWDEERFGREYDLDLYMIVATNDFNMGAMENKGLNIFNSKYVLAKTDTATDTDYENIEAVIAHEYFHNWTGNRITLKSWFELSLKEGLTVFRDQEFSADMNSRPIQRIKDVINLRLRQFPEDAGPMAHPIRPDSYIEMNNFYTMTVYEKGAEVIRMIYTIIGKEKFRKAMDLYFDRFDGMAITCDDFVDVMQESSQIDLSQFRLWYSQAGTPEVEVKRIFNKEKNIYELEISQNIPNTPGQSNKKPMHIPIQFALFNKNGNQITGEQILHLKEKKQIFSFENIKEEPIPSLLRNFSAPVKLNIEYSDDELVFLSANETDEFNRWEAIQKISLKIILELIDSIQKNKKLNINNVIYDIFKKNLNNQNLDKSFIALSISLPSEEDIYEQLEVIDVESTFKAREFLFKKIAENLEEEFLKIYNENKQKEFKMDALSISKRKLKNVCLNYLSYLDDKYIKIIFEQFENANNMTDKITALSILSNIDSEYSKIAIESFYQEYKNDTLVLDKWFSIQATSKLEGTLKKVINLISHPAFSIKNPNKVRALIGAFCSANNIHFHKIDGSGYKFLTEAVIGLNEINPQIAARMVSIFNKWKRFDKTRQELIKKELERIMKIENLSTDVYEIVLKALK